MSENKKVIHDGVNHQEKNNYDEQGRIIQTTYFNWSGENYTAIESVCNYMYLDSSLIKTICYDSNQVLIGWSNYHYDSKGKETIISYNSDSVESDRIIRMYIAGDLLSYQVSFENGIKSDSTLYTYNLNQQLESILYFKENSNEILNAFEFYYNASGSLATKLIKSPNYIIKYEYAYTSSGFIISSYLNEEKFPFQVQHFDKDSNETKVINYAKKLHIDNTTTSQYNDKGKITEQVFESKDGSERTTYTYDNYGNITEKKTYQSNLLVNETTWEYKYDSHGNWIQCIEFSFGSMPQHITSRVLTYY